jgi:hypothetical protein
VAQSPDQTKLMPINAGGTVIMIIAAGGNIHGMSQGRASELGRARNGPSEPERGRAPPAGVARAVPPTPHAREIDIRRESTLVCSTVLCPPKEKGPEFPDWLALEKMRVVYWGPGWLADTQLSSCRPPPWPRISPAGNWQQARRAGLANAASNASGGTAVPP